MYNKHPCRLLSENKVLLPLFSESGKSSQERFVRESRAEFSQEAVYHRGIESLQLWLPELPATSTHTTYHSRGGLEHPCRSVPFQTPERQC
jgi:hypothetical protein